MITDNHSLLFSTGISFEQLKNRVQAIQASETVSQKKLTLFQDLLMEKPFDTQEEKEAVFIRAFRKLHRCVEEEIVPEKWLIDYLMAPHDIILLTSCLKKDEGVKAYCYHPEMEKYISPWLPSILKFPNFPYVTKKQIVFFPQKKVSNFDLMAGFYFFCESIALYGGADNQFTETVIEYLQKAEQFHSFHAMTILLDLLLSKVEESESIQEDVLSQFLNRINELNHYHGAAGYFESACLILRLMNIAEDKEDNEERLRMMVIIATQYFFVSQSLIDHNKAELHNAYLTMSVKLRFDYNEKIRAQLYEKLSDYKEKYLNISDVQIIKISSESQYESWLQSAKYTEKKRLTYHG